MTQATTETPPAATQAPSPTTRIPPATIKRRPARRLLKIVSAAAPGLQPAAQRLLIRFGYAVVNRWMDQAQAECMNYGYAALDEHADAGASGGEAYCHQLYAHVAGATALAGKETLEVGCGRGGGAAYVAERFGVARLTGLDFSEKAITFARDQHTDPRLRFVRGDAEDLPFADGSFDVVLNVESSHCYPNVPRFIAEAFRVLRPGGHFVFADLRLQNEVDGLRQSFLDGGFRILEEESITPNVVRSLELDSPRRVAFVRQSVPRPLRPYVLDFAGASGTDVYNALCAGDLEYLRFALVKPAA